MRVQNSEKWARKGSNLFSPRDHLQKRKSKQQ